MLYLQLQTVLVPGVLIGGYIFFSSRDGFFADAWDGFLGPFLFTYWIGLGFMIVWDIVRHFVPKETLGPTATVIVGIVVVAFLLAQLDGPDAILDDIWLLGAFIAPGIEVMKPWLSGQHRPVETRPAGGEEQPKEKHTP